MAGRVSLLLILLFLPIPGYGSDALLIAASSNLSFALREIGREFERATGTEVILSFGSSGKLAQQIEYGAPFDLFFSANRGYVERLEVKGLVLRKEFYARGRLALVVNRRSGVRIETLDDLTRPDVRRISMANPDHAPYGMAAKDALEAAGVWERVRDKVVYGENIRQALQFVQTGDAQAGIVALSIADVPEVTYMRLDPSLHRPIDQMVAIIRGTDRMDEAEEFIRFLMGEVGRSVMERYGFDIPRSLP